jgi:outer membrane protein assembly factor BamA
MRQLAPCVGLALLIARGLVAQAAGQTPPPRRTWVDHLYPAVWYSSIDGFWLAGHYDWTSPLGFVERPEPTFARIALDAGASTQGSYSIILDAQAPAYWDGWRIALTAGINRANRFGYYGQGNGTAYVRDSTAGRSYFYRVSRTTQSARVTIQRRIVGPLRVLAGGTLDHTDFRDLPGTTLFQCDQQAGIIRPVEVPFNDRVGRIGVVLDWRDLEMDPHRGVLIEGLVSSGRGYTRRTASVRGYLHPLDRLVLAGRLAGEDMTGDPPLAAQFTMESSEGPIVAVGGYHSLRGYHDGRFLGPGKILGGLEARYGILWAPRLLEVKLLAFYDAARVFAPGESVRLTRDGLHSSFGGGVAMALMRNTVVTLDVGKGTEGTQIAFATTFAF